MFRAGFADGQVADAVKIPVLDGDFPTPPCLILFLGDDVFHDILPRPRCQLRIGSVEINLRQTEADGRLAFRLIHGVDLLFRLGLHPCLKAYQVPQERLNFRYRCVISCTFIL